MNRTTLSRLEILPYESKDRLAFQAINENWILQHFELEPTDKQLFKDPNVIIEQGGEIYMAFCCGKAAGTVALQNFGNGRYELAKMAVLPEFQGLGIGKEILHHALLSFIEKGGHELVLVSNRRLKVAHYLYRKFGFEEVPLAYGEANQYHRVDIKMKWTPSFKNLLAFFSMGLPIRKNIPETS